MVWDLEHRGGLAGRLYDFALSRQPGQLYRKNYRRANADQSQIPAAPLLYVPSHPGRSFDQDLEAAGIAKRTGNGKLDFHAARTAYLNLVFEDRDITLTDAQKLARHSTAKMTLEVYGRARDERLSAVVERMAQRIKPEKKCAIYVQQRATGTETEIATFYKTEGCDSIDMAPAVGLEPTTKWLTATRSAS